MDTEVESKFVSSSMIVTKSFYLLDKIASRKKKKKRERERDNSHQAKASMVFCF